MSVPPELARRNQLLEAAEQIFRTFTDHPYDKDLSYDVLAVLAPAIDDAAAYGEQLADFTDRFHERLDRDAHWPRPLGIVARRGCRTRPWPSAGCRSRWSRPRAVLRPHAESPTVVADSLGYLTKSISWLGSARAGDLRPT
ncbi:hypothetical protein ABZT43_50925 [Streptomyces sp. NPDC005349]|uniref:hypothetical protein n=1 Tax=Streptomyces sp. NPDC005349 TaxID=3157037 RepID=UPI0033A85B71